MNKFNEYIFIISDSASAPRNMVKVTAQNKNMAYVGIYEYFGSHVDVCCIEDLLPTAHPEMIDPPHTIKVEYANGKIDIESASASPRGLL